MSAPSKPLIPNRPDRNGPGFRAEALIGTGGIGSGRFFAVEGDHTLGREESRPGVFLDRRDYCKLHIITHYVRALMPEGFHALPIGMVGDDEPGAALLAEMAGAGIDVRYVATVPGVSTTFSFCIVYPDGSGCNLTTADSASSRVGRAEVAAAEEAFSRYRGRGIALAVPEAPLEARAALLELGSRYGFLRAASFTASETAFATAFGFSGIDLLAVNRDEAAALLEAAGLEPGERGFEAIAADVVAVVTEDNPSAIVAITAGADGIWVSGSGRIAHLPALEVPVVSTAGAGDAFFAGLLAGLASGLPPIDSAAIGRLLASYSVTFADTIASPVGRAELRKFADAHGIDLDSGTVSFLGGEESSG